MGSSIWGVMDLGRRAMMNSQSALQTTSHNIANKSTEGYSRQRVDFVNNEPVGLGKKRVGTGARITEVSRTNNPYLERQIQKEGVRLGESMTRFDSLMRVEQVFNEQVNKGVNKYMTEFFNGFRELANYPESLSARNMVKESADFLAKDINRANRQLKDIQSDVDFQIKRHVAEVNEITKEIANLNEKVMVVELNGVPANDERDRRDQLIKDLGELVNIRIAESEEGSVAITAGDTAVLVSGFSYRELYTNATKASKNKKEGNFDIFYKPTKEGSEVNITGQIRSGKLGGLVDVRDNSINKFMAGLDEMAYKLTEEVNLAHTYGYNNKGRKAPIFFDVGKNQVEGAAERIRLSESIMNDVGLIASAADPNSPGDARIANIIADIQYKDIMEEKTATVDEFYNSIVGEVGARTMRSKSQLDSQKDLMGQLKSVRESISGVSLDEETAKLIEYQKNFDASARLIRASDEMMETVLNLKRM